MNPFTLFIHTNSGLLAAGVLSALSLASSTEAASITWGAIQGITGDSDVSTNGVFVGALNLGGSGGPGIPSTTVNGVLFTGLGLNGSPASSGIFALSAANGVGFLSADPPFSTLSPDYRTLLSTFMGSSSVNITLTISGLLVGQSYEFEWWSNISSSFDPATTTATAGNAVTLLSSPNGLNGGVGQFVIGTFLADSASQIITFEGLPGVNRAVNGFQLRQIATVPEPSASTLTLLALTLGGLTLIVRRVLPSVRKSTKSRSIP